ncbi:hypothetical protein B0T14DRAFT_571788 [Immersiella caudata]|uniref:Uncharacterized protein n=1 Tax=Immersiella caudata TaxID=314043 RepID=A0AA39U6F2_9PEZI|nr:hypothetical protein B0T14DRAFT_571788 [Immersiella caudata]
MELTVSELTLVDSVHWHFHVIKHSLLILLTCWNIGAVVQVWSTLGLLYGHRQEDTGFMSAMVVGLVVALAVFCYKWFMLIMNRNVSPRGTRGSIGPLLPFAGWVACMERPILVGSPFWVLVLTVNVTFHYAAFAWWRTVTLGASRLPVLEGGLAAVNAQLLWMFYLVLVVLTAYQFGVARSSGYEQLWSLSIYFP